MLLFFFNLWLNGLLYANLNVTNKHPVACLERAAASLTVTGFFIPKAKRDEAFWSEKIFPAQCFIVPSILKRLLVSWYCMFLSFFMFVQISFDSSRNYAICNHIKTHIWVCLFLWICIAHVWLYSTISVYVSYLQNGLFTRLTKQSPVFILSCTPTDLYSRINRF